MTEDLATGAKSAEIIVNDIGEVTVAIRPELPFEAEEYLVVDAGRALKVRGEGLSLRIAIPAQIAGLVREASRITLIEYPVSGIESLRETEIDAQND